MLQKNVFFWYLCFFHSFNLIISIANLSLIFGQKSSPSSKSNFFCPPPNVRYCTANLSWKRPCLIFKRLPFLWTKKLQYFGLWFCLPSQVPYFNLLVWSHQSPLKLAFHWLSWEALSLLELLELSLSLPLCQQAYFMSVNNYLCSLLVILLSLVSNLWLFIGWVIYLCLSVTTSWWPLTSLTSLHFLVSTFINLFYQIQSASYSLVNILLILPFLISFIILHMIVWI